MKLLIIKFSFLIKNNFAIFAKKGRITQSILAIIAASFVAKNANYFLSAIVAVKLR